MRCGGKEDAMEGLRWRYEGQQEMTEVTEGKAEETCVRSENGVWIYGEYERLKIMCGEKEKSAVVLKGWCEGIKGKIGRSDCVKEK